MACLPPLFNLQLFIEAKAALHCKPDMQAKAAVLLAYVRQLYATAVANPLGLCSTNCPGRNKNGKCRHDRCACSALAWFLKGRCLLDGADTAALHAAPWRAGY